MTETQYKIVLALYNEYNEAFCTLSSKVQDEFYNILYSRKGFIPSPKG